MVHAAGLAHQFHNPKDPAPFVKINVEGTENVAQALREPVVRHFVLVSSVSVYGPHDDAVIKEDARAIRRELTRRVNTGPKTRAGVIGPTGACRPSCVFQ